MLSDEFEFAIGGAVYPEVHPEAESPESDLAAALRKVARRRELSDDADVLRQRGATSLSSRGRGRRESTSRSCPGIMPITSYEQIARIGTMSPGTRIPQTLLAELEVRSAEPEAIGDLGVAYCALQCAELLSRGVPGIHFYTLNKSPATRAVVSALLASRTSNALLATP